MTAGFFVYLLQIQPEGKASVRGIDVLKRETFCDMDCGDLLRTAFQIETGDTLIFCERYDCFGYFCCNSHAPEVGVQYPAKFIAAFCKGVEYHMTDQLGTFFPNQSIHQWRMAHAGVLQKVFCLFPIKGRLQILHHRWIGKDLVKITMI